MSDIANRVCEVIADQMKLSLDRVKPSASFTGDLGADSLATMELVMALEDKFDIEIPDEDSQKIQTVQDVIEYVSKKTEVA